MQPGDKDSTEFTTAEDELPEGFSVKDEDYIFVLNGDGELKSILFPDGDERLAPESVQAILRMFGLDNFQQPTLH